MVKKKLFAYYILTSFFIFLSLFSFTSNQSSDSSKVLSYVVDVKNQDLKFYWKDDKGNIFRSISNLKTWLDSKNKTLVFAMNGGMYMEDNTPLGLFINEGKIITKLNTRTGHGNFYMKPNGVFYITKDNKAAVCKTDDFKNNDKIKYATQSGPMLVVDGIIHSDFKQGSSNLNIRNGVGILPDNKVVFAMSKEPINFYDFATYFKELGCKNALYLDGFVSRTYLPEKKWEQIDGNFGVIIGVTLDKK